MSRIIASTNPPDSKERQLVTINSEYDTDVLVVGTGPMGATTALALATHGISVTAINKYNWVSRTPRAHITNQRAMEVFRALGVEEQVLREALPWEAMGETSFSTSLAGEEIARIRSWGSGEWRKGDFMKSSPNGLLDIPQSLLEPILINEAARRGAVFSFNTEYLSHEQDEHGVRVKIRNRITGEETTISARYLVGADGAKSKVLEDAGLDVVGLPPRDGTIYVEFLADLSKYVANRPSSLHWILSSEIGNGELGMALVRAIRPWNHWIAGWGFDGDNGVPELSEKMLISQLQKIVGDSSIDFTIIGTSTWFVNQQYAPRYSNGRVFCGGDATHRHPPSGGLGSNTCVQDAFNLGWKLAYVLKGFASDSLLETYSDERAPAGEFIVRQANRFRQDYAPFLSVLFEGGHDGLAKGIATLQSSSEEGVSARKQLESALALKETEYNGHGTQMHLFYESQAVISEHDSTPIESDGGSYFYPTTRPGAKVPHAWIVDESGRKTSTLDLVSRNDFTLVTGISGEDWVQAVDAMGLPFLKAIIIGSSEAKDLYFEWQRLREIQESGALLVRPDGVIAWRSNQGPGSVENANSLLAHALAQVLGAAPPLGSR